MYRYTLWDGEGKAPSATGTCLCGQCGNPTPRGHKFCSQRCYGLSKRDPAKASNPWHENCLHCGKPNGKYGNKYCSVACRGAAKRLPDAYFERTCDNCGHTYLNEAARQ